MTFSNAGSQPERLKTLEHRALTVLRENDLGSWTKPAPHLYPHQWSWDSAFIAIGLARVDPSRAVLELESLFAAQWADGRLPQIVYNPAAPPTGYFPDAARWDCAHVSSAAPRAPATSGICQPPVHGLAVWRIVESAPDLSELRPRLRSLIPALLAWHRYLAEQRDPEQSGLLTVYHPWESGTDNSPRWDSPLANVQVGLDLPAYVRRDLQHIADASQRPSSAEYDRYLWLVETLKRAGYVDAQVQRTHPFQVKDVLFSALFALSSRALLRLADLLGLPRSDLRELPAWIGRTTDALLARCAGADPLALDLDRTTGQPIAVQTWAGLTPLLLPDLPGSLAATLARRLQSNGFAGNTALALPAVPSTAPDSPGFRSQTYWRGPIWPIANWLLWFGLRQHHLEPAAAALRRANLALLAQAGVDFDEYFDPFSGAPLGSSRQSWSAAVALDWLAADDTPAPRL